MVVAKILVLYVGFRTLRQRLWLSRQKPTFQPMPAVQGADTWTCSRSQGALE